MREHIAALPVPQLRSSSVRTLMRLLSGYGLSDEEVERGMDYVEIIGARTVREGFELAMSRVLFSDEQLAAGSRFHPGEDEEG